MELIGQSQLIFINAACRFYFYQAVPGAWPCPISGLHEPFLQFIQNPGCYVSVAKR